MTNQQDSTSVPDEGLGGRRTSRKSKKQDASGATKPPKGDMRKVAANTRRNKADFLKALQRTLGIVSPACAKVNIPRSTYYHWVNTDAEFADAVKDVQEDLKDFGETALCQLVKAKNPAAVIFFNKTKNRDRGYQEGYSLLHQGDKEAPVEINNTLAVSPAALTTIAQTVLDSVTDSVSDG